jgi:hypothetical protein
MGEEEEEVEDPVPELTRAHFEDVGGDSLLDGELDRTLCHEAEIGTGEAVGLAGNEGEDITMGEEEEEVEDPVPELTRAHFEEAMKSARRSWTSPADGKRKKLPPPVFFKL